MRGPWKTARMRRRHLLALSPLAALAACTGPEPDPPAGPGTSDGGGASDAGGASDSGGSSDAGGAEPSPSPTPPSAAEQLLEELTDRELAGQLVLVGITAGSTPDPALLTEHHVGGFFLLQVWQEAAAVDAVISTAREQSREDLPPLIAVDQEGGQVRMLRGEAARRTDSAEVLGAAGPDAVREAYGMIGEDLAARGIHLNLAPVADVVDPQLGGRNEPVGGLDRGFGTDPEHVGQCVRAAVEALAEQGVGSTLKHFPGLGRVERNTDFSAEGIEDATTTLDDPFLDSFAAGIAARAEAVMLSSAIYPQLEPEVPAMFSSVVVTELLREQLGFTGVVMTDDIGAAKAVQSVPVAERATRLLDAGGDAVLTADPSLAGQLVDAIQQWAEETPEQAERVRESAGRMLALKQARGLL